MQQLDWLVLFGTLFFIVSYGIWKTRDTHDVKGFFLGNRNLKWWTIGLSIMATQASAITFLSTPGQAYEDGMRFIQFYFGLPIAMIILSIFFIPKYYKLNVYTAYEYLEGRFDLKTRSLTAFFFLIQRGLAAGITIYAPSIILSTILGWQLTYTNLLIGLVVILYTVAGGTRAVSQTQKHQMVVMLGGMIVAGIVVINLLPKEVGLGEALHVAGKMGKLNLVELEFDINDRYNIWSGLIGGFFLALSYFGTDQSQVARYLSGKSLTESRLGLLMNGLVKVPMQFLILGIGTLVFVFYQFTMPPLFFNKAGQDKMISAEGIERFAELEAEQERTFAKKKDEIYLMLDALSDKDEEKLRFHQERIQALQLKEKQVRDEAKVVISQEDAGIETRDTDYIFITFVMNYLPTGLVGLLLAVIFSAAMSSTSSELNALASTSTMDLYKRSLVKEKSDGHYLRASRGFTIFWGLIAISFATFASLLDNLIQAVNILGSLFYGTVLGVFLVAFLIKWVRGHAVFIAALLAEALVLYLYVYTEIGYLNFNIIGCMAVIFLSMIIQGFINLFKASTSSPGN